MIFAIILSSLPYSAYSEIVERIVHKAQNFKEAEAGDVLQHRAMTPNERMRAAKQIRDRLFPSSNPDLREWHRTKKDK